jgi:hypothetical protein
MSFAGDKKARTSKPTRRRLSQRRAAEGLASETSAAKKLRDLHALLTLLSYVQPEVSNFSEEAADLLMRASDLLRDSVDRAPSPAFV